MGDTMAKAKKDWREKYEKYDDAIHGASDKVLVANWFLPEHIELFLGREITEQEYLTIVGEWKRGGCADSVSEEIRSWLLQVIDDILAEK